MGTSIGRTEVVFGATAVVGARIGWTGVAKAGEEDGMRGAPLAGVRPGSSLLLWMSIAVEVD